MFPDSANKTSYYSHLSRKWPGLDKKLKTVNLSTNVCVASASSTPLLHLFLIHHNLYLPSIAPYLAEGCSQISLPNFEKKKKSNNKIRKSMRGYLGCGETASRNRCRLNSLSHTG